jgi:hypothetical protein
MERTTAMIAAQDRAQLVEDLSRMLDELCAPELTLARADVLRPRVDRLVATLREWDASPYPRTDRDRLEGGSRLARMS